MVGSCSCGAVGSLRHCRRGLRGVFPPAAVRALPGLSECLPPRSCPQLCLRVRGVASGTGLGRIRSVHAGPAHARAPAGLVGAPAAAACGAGGGPVLLVVGNAGIFAAPARVLVAGPGDVGRVARGEGAASVMSIASVLDMREVRAIAYSGGPGPVACGSGPAHIEGQPGKGSFPGCPAAGLYRLLPGTGVPRAGWVPVSHGKALEPAGSAGRRQRKPRQISRRRLPPCPGGGWHACSAGRYRGERVAGRARVSPGRPPAWGMPGRRAIPPRCGRRVRPRLPHGRPGPVARAGGFRPGGTCASARCASPGCSRLWDHRFPTRRCFVPCGGVCGAARGE